MNPLSRLFNPRSVAVIGASADASKTAGRPVAYLRKHGFTGDIYPVNPRVESIDGLPCYQDIASLPGVPDVAIVLGTGLGGLANVIESAVSIDYAELPGFPLSTVESMELLLDKLSKTKTNGDFLAAMSK